MRVHSVIGKQILRKYPKPIVNLKSSELRFKNDLFFVNIFGYGKNTSWAKKIKNVADDAVNHIVGAYGCEDVLKVIASGVREANKIPIDLTKRIHSGLLRTEREGWKTGSWKDKNIDTAYGKGSKIQYRSYADKFDAVVKNPLRNPYDDIQLTVPCIEGAGKSEKKYLLHANPRFIPQAFKHITKLYNELRGEFGYKKVQEKDLDKINASIAEIRWIMAHATPWERGSDAISNVFTRAMYKSFGIKTFPFKKGISLDMQAYCTNLNEYKKEFVFYFEQVPKFVE